MQSNEALLIEDTTRKAFSNDADDVAAAVKTLTGLKGIGPATASLLLSVYAPESVPFFSDVSFACVKKLASSMLMHIITGAVPLDDVG